MLAPTDMRDPAADPAEHHDPPPSIADGRSRRLDPRFVSAQRTARWIAVGIMATVALPGAVASALFAAGVTAVLASLAAGAVLFALLAWWAHGWPALAWRHASYAVDQAGIEMRRGVVWRRTINVPRSRVQHTDVSQGPVERAYELGTLIIHTAGTDQARVHLPGLTHADALLIRDHLLPTDSHDVV
jgi:hypothetical protein